MILLHCNMLQMDRLTGEVTFLTLTMATILALSLHPFKKNVF